MSLTKKNVVSALVVNAVVSQAVKELPDIKKLPDEKAQRVITNTVVNTIKKGAV